MFNFMDCENLCAAFFGPYKFDESHFDSQRVPWKMFTKVFQQFAQLFTQILRRVICFPATWPTCLYLQLYLSIYSIRIVGRVLIVMASHLCQENKHKVANLTLKCADISFWFIKRFAQGYIVARSLLIMCACSSDKWLIIILISMLVFLPLPILLCFAINIYVRACLAAPN